MSNEKIQVTFDEWANSGFAAGMEADHGDVVEQVLEAMAIAPGEKLLDLGCGMGWATRLLAKAAAGAQAVGVDASPRMIELAEEAHSFTIRARYEVMPFDALDFPDASFSRVFSMEAIYYAPDLARTLSEAHRVLQPGGQADVVLNFHGDSPGTQVWQEHIDVPMVWMDAAGWEQAFRDAGFDQVETRTVTDRRGPGEEAEFRPSKWCPDWATKVAVHEAGSLWIRAVKSA